MHLSFKLMKSVYNLLMYLTSVESNVHFHCRLVEWVELEHLFSGLFVFFFVFPTRIMYSELINYCGSSLDGFDVLKF
jgi:hypothetical protein